ncbi:MAG: diadenylate cyclase CdaA [Clostridia bacterium]|nr:diadenylate cyclase CdaA [Clostridia bacterium]
MFENFSEYFEQIKRAIISFNTIGDLLDVLLVAFVIYNGVKLIRETRAIQLAKGVILLGVVYFFVSLFNMETSKYILSLVFGNLLIILVIIFSPEIRHALESVGRSSVSNINLLNFKKRDEQEQEEFIKSSINAVCKACGEMSDKNIGALIVFEKETKLGEIAKTGTNIDAVVTTEMISNIFFPKAPMHDGAVIIKDGRVSCAGCILPLTSRGISSDLGTRHRAAIGMSESSDAIVVIVSEETGAISFAKRGVLKRNVSVGDLREVLSKEFIKPVNKENKIIKRKNRGNKDE